MNFEEELSVRLNIPVKVVSNLLSGFDEEKAIELDHLERFDKNYFSNKNIDRYEIKLSGYSDDPNDHTISYLDILDSASVVSSEAEQSIKDHQSYKDYLELTKSGSKPPPITVIKNNRSDKFVSANRRRLLVAQELKIPICAWVESDTVGEHGLPLTLGRFKEERNKLREEINNKREFDRSVVWYHGTNVDFSEFDLECFGKNEEGGDYIGKAIFFANSRFTAKKYAKQAGGDIVKEVYLSMNNPLVIPKEGIPDSYYDDIVPEIYIDSIELRELREAGVSESEIKLIASFEMSETERAEYCKSKGYDGLLDLKYGQAAVFCSSQIEVIEHKNKLNLKVAI